MRSVDTCSAVTAEVLLIDDACCAGYCRYHPIWCSLRREKKDGKKMVLLNEGLVRPSRRVISVDTETYDLLYRSDISVTD
jgi:hypothetical protein